jgi:UDP-glucose 4-epimerase
VTTVVTGAQGLLGSAVVRDLLDSGTDEIVALARTCPTNHADGGQLTWVQQDLREPLSRSLPRRVDTVIHLAQSREHREFPSGAVDTFEVAVSATVRLLDYCLRAGGTRFVLASSGAVYGPSATPAHEQAPLHPATFHGISKLAAEQAASSFHRYFAVTILRFFFVYGEGQESGAFLPGIVARVRDGVPVELAGEVGMRCNPIYVDDAARAVRAAMVLERGQTVNVAGRETVSLRELATLIGEELQREPTFNTGHAGGDLIADTALMERLLPIPEVTLSEGLARISRVPRTG